MTPQPFGQTINGEQVRRVELENGTLKAGIMTWGAVLLDLQLRGYENSLVLGFDNFEFYQQHSPYCGAIVGRFANRIGNANFDLGGKRYETDRNFRSKHTLHGGSNGTSQRLWDIKSLKENSVTLQLLSPHGHMGFPGNCMHTCRYELLPDNVLEVELTSRTDAPTVAGIAHHSYFNLDGSNDSREHILQIDAASYLPIDADLIPTGKIAPVHGTAFDFSKARSIGSAEDFDHNFCLATARRNLTACAIAKSAKSGIEMRISTTEPGMQFYNGSGINTPEHKAYAGFCLETQNWPDAPNQPGFPTAQLNPDEVLIQKTRYSFSKG